MTTTLSLLCARTIRRALTRPAALALVLALAFTAWAGGEMETPRATAPESPTLTLAAGTSLDRQTYERRVQRWINRKRARRDLPALQVGRCLRGTARNWTDHLINVGEFYHQQMSVLVDNCNMSYASETLAYGGVSPHRAVRMWMQSPPHRRAIMSRYPERFAVGAKRDGLGYWMVTANFGSR